MPIQSLDTMEEDGKTGQGLQPLTPLHATEDAEGFLRSVIDCMDTHTVVLDGSGQIISTNRTWREFAEANNAIGPTVQVGGNYLTVCDKAKASCPEAGRIGDAIRAVLAGEAEPDPVEYPCHAPRQHRWFLCSVRGFVRGAHRYAVVSHLNISEVRQAETKLRRLSAVVEQTPASVIITDRAGRIEYVNPAFTKHTGYSAEEVIGKNPRLLQSGKMPSEFYEDMWNQLRAGKEWRGELHNRHKDGHLFWELAVISPLRDPEGVVTHYLAIEENITEQKAMEDQLRIAACTDRLTGLSNRMLFHDRLQQAVQRARRVKDYRFAVLFLDFDRFKLVNDSLGHDVGDLLLQEIAARLRATIRNSDSLGLAPDAHTTARFGGDEFVVLLDGIRGLGDAVAVAERMLAAFALPYQLDNHQVYSTASIGVVTSDLSCESAENVLRDADTAMYEAKLAGRSKYVEFDVSMRERVQRRMNLENDLRRAVENDEMYLNYQPIISLITGRVEGHEALVRWVHPGRGQIMPNEFIPVAEETGLIVSIGEWVLREACTQFVRWQEQLGEAAPRHISVNLSRAQLMSPRLPMTVARVLEQTGIQPPQLFLEITETAIMEDLEAATRMLRAIRALGVRLSMDDFGTGHSSLACLHQFPIDRLKIDRSFIANLDRGREYTALVYAVADLARNLHFDLVAEGVETREQLAVLQSLDCEFGQGYLFSQPLSAESATAFTLPPGLLTPTTTTSASAA